MKPKLLLLQLVLLLVFCVCSSATYTHVNPYNMEDIEIALVVSSETCSGASCHEADSIELGNLNTNNLTISNPQPENGTVFESTTNSFNLSIDTSEAATCRYSTQMIGFENMTSAFNTTDNLSHTKYITGLSENNTYDYYILCMDSSGNINEGYYHLHYVVAALDRIPPVVTLISPENNYTHLGISMNFTYMVSDNSGISRCYLYTDSDGEWGIDAEDSYVTRDTSEKITLGGLSSGVYTWNVECYDSLNNSALAPNNFTITVNAWVPLFVIGDGRDCGEDSAEDEKFCDPKGIDVDSDGRIYVLDTGNHRFQVFGSNLTHLETEGGLDNDGIELGMFEDPEGIAVRYIDEDITYIYITDTRNHRVEVRFQDYVFDNETNQTVVNDSWEEFGMREGSTCDYEDDICLEYPKGIVVDESGDVYVADMDEDRVQIIGSDFEAPAFIFDGSDSADEELSSPEGIAIDSSGNIVISDTGNNMIRIFDSSGEQIRSFGGLGSGEGEFNSPAGIDVDDENHIFVADRGNHRVQVLDSYGEYIASFGEYVYDTDIYDDPGLYMGKFSSPNDVRVFGNMLYIADTENHRIQVFLIPDLPAARVSFEVELEQGWNLFSIPLDT